MMIYNIKYLCIDDDVNQLKKNVKIVCSLDLERKWPDIAIILTYKLTTVEFCRSY